MRTDRWPRYGLLLGLAGWLWSGSVLLSQWQPLLPHTALAQAQEMPKSHEHSAHDHKDHEDLGPFMIRNAYHLSTLYHAGRAAQWDLASHEVAALGENLTRAVAAAPTFAGALQDFKHTHVEALEKAVETRQMAPFLRAFRTTVQGCNDCHKATKHAFITIPETPPNLSIFTLPPARAQSAPPAPRGSAAPGHRH